MAKTLHTILMAPFGMDNNNRLQAINPENANDDYKKYIGLFEDCTSLEDIGRKLTEMLAKPACIAKYANAVMATIKQKPDAFAHRTRIINACNRAPYTAEEVMSGVLSMIGGSEQTASAVSRIIESLIAEAPEKQL